MTSSAAERHVGDVAEPGPGPGPGLGLAAGAPREFLSPAAHATLLPEACPVFILKKTMIKYVHILLQLHSL